MRTTPALHPPLDDLQPCQLPPTPPAGDVVMSLLRHHVPLSLLVDLVLPGAPCSAEVMVREEEPGAWVHELVARRAAHDLRARSPRPTGDFAERRGRC